MTYFSGSKVFGCFEKHPKVVSGTLRGGFRAREVFGSFEKRTPEEKRKLLRGSSCRGAELPRVKLSEIQRKSILVRGSTKFELARARIIES